MAESVPADELEERKMKQIESDVRAIGHIWKKSFVGLFPVLFLARLMVWGILLPLFGGSLKLALRFAGYSYLTAQNIGVFLCRPSAWLFLSLWLLVFSALFFIEQMLTIYYFKLRKQEMEFRMTELVRFCLAVFRKPQKRGLFFMLPVASIYKLLTCIVVVVYILQKIRIPNNLFTDLQTLFPLLLLLLFVLLVFLAAGFLGIFTGSYYTIERLSVWESWKRGLRLLHRNIGRTLILYLLVMFGIAAFSALFYLLVMSALAAVMKLFMEDCYVLAKLLAMYDSINLVVGFLIATLSVYLFQGMIVHLFYQYKDEWDELTSDELAYGYVEKNQLRRYVVLMRVFMVAMVAVSILSVWNIVRNGTFQTAELLPTIGITAHRGQSVGAPENTLPALQLAIQQSADYAEIDVRLTADGVPVLMHDSSLRRTCGVARNISKVTFDELEQMDAGIWFSKDYQGTWVPTLAEALELCKGSINLNIEIKAGGDREELVKKVIALIKEYDFENQCIISSTDYETLLTVKKEDENLETGLILSMAYGNYYDREGIDFFSLKSAFVTRSTVDRLHELGKGIHVWTVDRKTELQRMRNLGVDNIITDDVILARQICFGDMDSTFFGILQTIGRRYFSLVDTTLCGFKLPGIQNIVATSAQYRKYQIFISTPQTILRS